MGNDQCPKENRVENRKGRRFFKSLKKKKIIWIRFWMTLSWNKLKKLKTLTQNKNPSLRIQMRLKDRVKEKSHLQDERTMKKLSLRPRDLEGFERRQNFMTTSTKKVARRFLGAMNLRMTILIQRLKGRVAQGEIWHYHPKSARPDLSIKRTVFLH